LAISKLRCKNNKFERTEEYKNNFQELKRHLVLPLFLVIPKGNEGFMIYNNASKKGLGCVLMQKGRVIAYASC